VKRDGKVKLLQGKDVGKDQSYFLYRLTQEQLNKVIFPLGELKKDKVRKLAQEAGLSTYDRPDSQGICFIGKVDIKEFLKKEIKPKVGKVKHINGEVIGRHDGGWYYTIGQRHGFEVEKYYGLPLYVVDKNVEKNELIVGFARDVLEDEFKVEDIHWISGREPDVLEKGILDCEVRIRHLGKLYSATIVREGARLKVKMTGKTFGIAPGQSAVFYDGEEVLGGGIIAG
jgi:tRNA-specific 2-thiouridylase